MAIRRRGIYRNNYAVAPNIISAVSWKFDLDYKWSLFRHCPFLNDHFPDVDKIYATWREYKMSVPTYGAIMLDETMQYVSSRIEAILQDLDKKWIWEKTV